MGDTTQGSFPVYIPSYQPWYDPLDTLPAFLSRIGYFKPYFFWRQSVPEYEDLAIVPANQSAYLLQNLPVVWTSSPYTRVRFDQSSRRTQLLSVLHGQTFRQRGGLSLAYRRRTREGEYVGLFTDHMTGALHLYGYVGKFWLQVSGGWNQLQDQLNGGVLYDSASGPWQAFQKERQPVRFSRMQWRRWHRYLRTEAGVYLSARTRLSLEGEIAEDRIQSESQAARRLESPWVPLDTLPLTWSSTTQRFRGSLRLQTPIVFGQLALLHHTGKADTLLRPWHYTAAEGTVLLHWAFFSLRGEYRHWLSPHAPPPAGTVELKAAHLGYEGGIRLGSRNLPWIAYQGFWASPSLAQPNEVSLHGWAAYRLPMRDSLTPPISFTAWATQYQRAWLWEMPVRRGSSLWTYGITTTGGWSGSYGGFIAGLTLQQIQGEAGWATTLPLLSGWSQVFLRGQLPGRPPLYELGLRLSGFSGFRPLQYDPRLGVFYYSATLPMQPAYAWIDPYFVVRVQRVLVYLRVDRATEGLWQEGYYLTAWYPMPGRAFSFGVQWDIYN